MRRSLMSHEKHYPLTLREKLRTSSVKRWHIVAVVREQNVAEHSFNVCLIAEEIARILGVPEKLEAVRKHAIHHDIPEVITGDLPTTIKKTYSLEGKDFDYILDPDSEPQSKIVAWIVKLADIIEAVLYLQQYGAGSHAHRVRESLVNRVNTMVEDRGSNNLTKQVSDWMMWETKTADGEIL
jgi:5'-deoxynucleotidase YfbR-like HD superfamily hydrolase